MIENEMDISKPNFLQFINSYARILYAPPSKKKKQIAENIVKIVLEINIEIYYLFSPLFLFSIIQSNN